MNDAMDMAIPSRDVSSREGGGASWEGIDLFCLQCGYNLRGLTGDPRRCPECFFMNPVGDLAIPAAVIAGQIRRMEGIPAGCVALALLGLPMLVATMMVSGEYIGVVVVLLGIWIRNVHRFRFYCLGNLGWRAALIEYHLLALTLCIAVLVVPCTSSAMIAVGHPWLRHPAAFPILISSLAALGLFVILASSRIHSRLKGILEPLQREVAVTLARAGLRNALRTGKSARHYRP